MSSSMSRPATIKEMIERSGYSDSELAKQLNVTTDEVAQWKANEGSVPFEQRHKVATLLGVSPDDISTGRTDTS